VSIVKRIVVAAALGFTLFLRTSFATSPPHVAPPAAIVEHPGNSPHSGFAWKDGYYRWNGYRYIWSQGHWVNPPRPGQVWVPGHWEQRKDVWVFVEGHWTH
jgi:hypothetical protein